MKSVTILLLGLLVATLTLEHAAAESRADISGSKAEGHLENVIRRIVKRQTKITLTPKGDGGELKITNTRGGRRLGGSIYHGKTAGTGLGAFGSYTWPRRNGASNSFGGNINHGFGSGTSAELRGSRTWSHGGGRSTSLGGFINHNFGSGSTGGGLRLTHRF